MSGMKAKVLAGWGLLPWAGRLIFVLVLVAAVYFYWTRTAKPGKKGPAGEEEEEAVGEVRARTKAAKRTKGPPERVAQRSPQASYLDPLRGMVREAAESAKRSASAGNPYQQLLHVQWALAKLDAARKVAEAVAKNEGFDEQSPEEVMSAASGIHVGKLGAFLRRAQELCSERIESVASAAEA